MAIYFIRAIWKWRNNYQALSRLGYSTSIETADYFTKSTNMNYPFHMTAINHYDKCYNSTGQSARPTLEHPARVRHVEGFSKDINVIVTENILHRYDILNQTLSKV